MANTQRMRLDLVIPTYNRANLLPSVLHSLLEATLPETLDVHFRLIDNNSKDSTAQVVQEWLPAFKGKLLYQVEKNQGLSHARNAGIRASDADLIGFIDDDERLHPDWFKVAADAFSDPGLQFLGGPCLPDWSAPIPNWLPKAYPAVIGWIEPVREERPYNSDFPGILMGGNAVIRRTVFEQIGCFNTQLGRSDKGLFTGEDEDFYKRLLAARFHGRYSPALIIYHYIPKERLTRTYYRRWCFWHQVSYGWRDRFEPMEVRRLAGVPRWYYRSALMGLFNRLREFCGYPPDKSFAAELDVVRLVGYMYGRYWFRRFGSDT